MEQWDNAYVVSIDTLHPIEELSVLLRGSEELEDDLEALKKQVAGPLC